MKHLKQLIVIILSLPLIVIAQDNTKGIQFAKGLTWDQVKAKAKDENKYIFVDCYTTWCVPCKQMENSIYPDQKVGDFFNKNFVSVKVQIDKTGNDNSEIKAWYQTAKFIESEYKVIAYPTFLFFTPEGKIVHRAAGGFPSNQFISLGKNAMDSSKQYYTLLASYKPEQMDTAQLKAMALKYRSAGPELAGMILTEYFKRLPAEEKWTTENLKLLQQFSSIDAAKEIADSYINSLRDEDMYTYETIHLLSFFTKSPSDRGFQIFYKDPIRADSAMNQDRFARNKVVSTIIRTTLNPEIEKARNQKKTPDWKKLEQMLAKKYGADYASCAILIAKINWRGENKDIPGYRKAIVDYLDKFITWENDFNLNNFAWSFFQKVSDRSMLQKALKWSEESLRLSPNAEWMDTYANLLYKLGDSRHAILWEQNAIALDNGGRSQEKKGNLEKMKVGQPTWPTTTNN